MFVMLFTLPPMSWNLLNWVFCCVCCSCFIYFPFNSLKIKHFSGWHSKFLMHILSLLFFQFYWQTIDTLCYISLRRTTWFIYIAKWLSQQIWLAPIILYSYNKKKRKTFTLWWEILGPTLLNIFLYTTQQC